MFFVNKRFDLIAAGAEDLKVLFSFIEMLDVIAVDPASDSFSVLFAVAANVIENQTTPIFVVAAVNTHPTEVLKQIESLLIVVFVIGAVICAI